MPALILQTGVIATHDTFSFSEKDWRVFLGDRISSVYQTNGNVAPDSLEVVQSGGICKDPARIATLTALFEDVRKNWVPPEAKKGGL